MIAAIVIVACCLLLEGFFSGSEIAIVSADRIRVRQRAAAGDRAAALLEAFYEAPQRILATTLVGTNFSVVTATVVLTLALLARGKPEWLPVAILSPTLLTFGEVIPKTLFQQNADRLAPRVIRVLWVVSKLVTPVWWLVGRVAGAVSRLLGVAGQRALVTREELKLLLKGTGSGPQKSEITDGERRMIRNIFEFGDTTVADLMVPLSEVFALPDGAPLEVAARESLDKRHSRVPVFHERVDRVVGILHVFDLLRAGAQAGTVGGLMRPPVFAPESQLAVDLLRRLQREHQGMAVVVDEYGGTVGVVTIEDILEEIVGEIEDEYDRAEPMPITTEAPGVWRVAARTPLGVVNSTVGLQLAEGEDYESLGGFVLDQLRRIPRVGEQLRVGTISIEVTRASERAVEEVLIRTGKR
ncbi:MAG: HlyC/CorC family transporter [Deltaproteobacteria bacterium]|nr:HlyC/CorC family transporter [Deltaproteobacteria bacterium]